MSTFRKLIALVVAVLLGVSISLTSTPSTASAETGDGTTVSDTASASPSPTGDTTPTPPADNTGSPGNEGTPGDAAGGGDGDATPPGDGTPDGDTGSDDDDTTLPAVPPADAEEEEAPVGPGGFSPFSTLPGGHGSYGTPLGAQQEFFVYMGAGDLLDVRATFGVNGDNTTGSGSSRQVAAGLQTRLNVYDASGNLVKSANQNWTGSAAPVARTLNVLAGDLAGHTTGVWRGTIELWQNGALHPRYNAIPVYNWDVIPKSSGGTARTGRVWAESIRLAQYRASYSAVSSGPELWFSENPIDFNFYALSENGIVYQTTLRDYNGISSRMFATSTGNQSSCSPNYRSGGGTSAWYPPAALREHDAGSPVQSCGIEYRLFLESPDASMPQSGVASVNGSTWAYRSYTTPNLTNLALNRTNPATSYAGTLTAQSNTQGVIAFEIDTSGLGTFAAANTVTVYSGQVNPGGTGTATWNGNAPNGQPPTAKRIHIRAKLQSISEFHIVRDDVEYSAGGIEIRQTTGPNVGNTTIYFNDTNLRNHCWADNSTTNVPEVRDPCVGTIPTAAQRDGTSGVNSAGGVHRWGTPGNQTLAGGWGDTRFIDDWAYATDAAAVSGTLEVRGPDDPPQLTVTKNDGNQTRRPGEQYTYTIRVANGADLADEDDATITDRLPAAVTFVSASGGGSYDAATRVVTWDGLEVLSGGSITRTVTVRVNNDVVRPSNLVNFVTVTPSNAGSGTPPALPSDPASTTACTASSMCDFDTDNVPAANMSINKTGDKDQVARGETVVWTVTATNNASVLEPQFLLTDRLPAGVTFVSASDGGSHAAGVVTWPRADVAAGDSITRTVTVTVNADAARPVTMTNYALGALIDATPATPPTSPAGCTAAILCGYDQINTVAPNMVITKTGSVDQVAPRDEVTWTITARNATAVVEPQFLLTDRLPAGVTFVSASNGGTHSGGVVTWDRVDVAAGATITRTVVVRVNDNVARPVTMTNYALGAIEGETPGNPANPDECTAAILCGYDQIETLATRLTITKDDGLTYVYPTQALTYTIVASNPAALNEPQALIVDTLPVGLTYVSSSDGGDYDPATRKITWPRVDLAAGASVTRTVDATVNLDVARPANLTNYAQVTPITVTPGDPTQGCAAPGCASDTDQTVAPNLLIEKDDGQDLVAPGQELTYVIDVRNLAAAVEPQTLVTDYLPEGLTFVSASNGGSYNATTRVITWPRFSLGVAPNNHAVRQVVATVDDDIERPSTFTNVATVTPTNRVPVHPSDECALPTCATDTNRTEIADLQIAKTDGQTVVYPGQELTYELTIVNGSPVRENGVLVTDDLPEGLTFMSASDGGTYDQATRRITWDRFSIDGNDRATRTVTATVDMDVARPSDLTNVARVTESGVDPKDPGTPCDIAEDWTCDIDVDQTLPPNVTITKTGDVDQVAPEDQVVWTIQARNAGAVTEPQFVLIDRLPAGVTFVSASDGGVLDNGTVRWDAVDLAAGATITRTITVTVNTDVERPVTMTNYAQGVPVSNPEPPIPGSPSDCTTLCGYDQIETIPADLLVEKTDGRELVEPGDELVYTITVTNLAQTREASVALVDHLPSDVTFVEASDGGVVDGNRVAWERFALDAGQTATRTVTVRVNDDIARPAEFTNLVVVAPTNAKPADPTESCDAPWCDSDTNRTALADIRIVKQAVDADLRDGGVVSWLIQVGNLSTEQRARNVVVTDTLPPQLDATTVTFTELTQGDMVDGVWQVGELAPGATATAVVTGTITNPELAAGDVLVNLVRVSTPDDPTKGNPDTDCVANADLATDTDGCDYAELFPGTTLQIVKDDGVDEAVPGDTLTYVIVATNTGDVIEPAAVIDDFLPQEVTFVEASDGGSYDRDSHTVTWEPTQIDVGESVTREVTVKVRSGIDRPGEFTNYVTVTGTGDDPIDPADGCEGPRCDLDTNQVPKAQIATGLPGGDTTNLWLAGVGALMVVVAGAAAVHIVRNRRRTATAGVEGADTITE